MPNSKNPLTICLIGGPPIHPKYLTDEQKDAFLELEEIVIYGNKSMQEAGREVINNVLDYETTEVPDVVISRGKESIIVKGIRPDYRKAASSDQSFLAPTSLIVDPT